MATPFSKPRLEVRELATTPGKPDRVVALMHANGMRALVKLTHSYDTDTTDPKVVRYETADDTYPCSPRSRRSRSLRIA